MPSMTSVKHQTRDGRASSSLRAELDSLSIRALKTRFPGFNIRCGVLLIRAEDGRMLMVTEKPRDDFVGNLIGPPKGSIQRSDRNCADTACRELFEETGINITAQSLSQSYFIFHHPYFREMLIVFIAIMSNAPEPQPDGVEISECAWLSIDELKNKDNMSAYTQRLINCLYTLCLSDCDECQAIVSEP